MQADINLSSINVQPPSAVEADHHDSEAALSKDHPRGEVVHLLAVPRVRLDDLKYDVSIESLTTNEDDYSPQI